MLRRSAILACAVVLAACEGMPSCGAETPAGLEVFLLKDAQMSFETARERPLQDLVLQAKPWIAAADVDRYDWSSHCIYLKRHVPVPRRQILLSGTPFVVIADGQRCYLGALWSLISSRGPEGNVPMIDHDSENLVEISIGGWRRPGERPTDPRLDARVMKALRQKGQLHAGLDCSLDKVRVEHQGDRWSVVYTYTLRNKDEDDLYVLDPERINPVFFHDFQNGVSGCDVDDGARFLWPNPRKIGPQPTPWGKVDVAWLSRMKKGEAMTRTVVMSDMPRIVSGKYECHFRFSSPGFGTSWGPAKNEELRRPDGRIWLGRISATLVTDLSGK